MRRVDAGQIIFDMMTILVMALVSFVIGGLGLLLGMYGIQAGLAPLAVFAGLLGAFALCTVAAAVHVVCTMVRRFMA